MLINKFKYMANKSKKVLHKIKKQWVVVSVVLLGLLGGTAITTQVHINADENNSQPTITQQDNQMHSNLVNNANQKPAMQLGAESNNNQQNNTNNSDQNSYDNTSDNNNGNTGAYVSNSNNFFMPGEGGSGIHQTLINSPQESGIDVTTGHHFSSDVPNENTTTSESDSNDAWHYYTNSDAIASDSSDMDTYNSNSAESSMANSATLSSASYTSNTSSSYSLSSDINDINITNNNNIYASPDTKSYGWNSDFNLSDNSDGPSGNYMTESDYPSSILDFNSDMGTSMYSNSDSSNIYPSDNSRSDSYDFGNVVTSDISNPSSFSDPYNYISDISSPSYSDMTNSNSDISTNSDEPTSDITSTNPSDVRTEGNITYSTSFITVPNSDIHIESDNPSDENPSDLSDEPQIANSDIGPSTESDGPTSNESYYDNGNYNNYGHYDYTNNILNWN